MLLLQQMFPVSQCPGVLSRKTLIELPTVPSETIENPIEQNFEVKRVKFVTLSLPYVGLQMPPLQQMSLRRYLLA